MLHQLFSSTAGTFLSLFAIAKPTRRVIANPIGALNRVLGFLILAIAVQLIADGVFALLKDAAPNLFH